MPESVGGYNKMERVMTKEVHLSPSASSSQRTEITWCKYVYLEEGTVEGRLLKGYHRPELEEKIHLLGESIDMELDNILPESPRYVVLAILSLLENERKMKQDIHLSICPTPVAANRFGDNVYGMLTMGAERQHYLIHDMNSAMMAMSTILQAM
jgi:hypothetical protein